MTQMNMWMKQKQTHIWNRLVTDKGEGGWGRAARGGKGRKFGINRSKLLLFICRTDKQ